MLSKIKKLKMPNLNYIALSLMVAILVFSYYTFSQYRPQVNIEVEEVKGTRAQRVTLPLPRESLKISDTEVNDSSRQITLQTMDSGEKVQNFYANILLSKEWRVDKEGTEDIFYITKYRRGESTVTVSTTKQQTRQSEDEATIAIIEIEE